MSELDVSKPIYHREAKFGPYPYGQWAATLYINDVPIGVSFGDTKREAKDRVKQRFAVIINNAVASKLDRDA